DRSQEPPGMDEHLDDALSRKCAMGRHGQIANDEIPHTFNIEGAHQLNQIFTCHDSSFIGFTGGGGVAVSGVNWTGKAKVFLMAVCSRSSSRRGSSWSGGMARMGIDR